MVNFISNMSVSVFKYLIANDISQNLLLWTNKLNFSQITPVPLRFKINIPPKFLEINWPLGSLSMAYIIYVMTYRFYLSLL